MGRLSRTKIAINSGTTDVHVFIDNSGNVTQIGKKQKNRLKYYIDETLPQPLFEPPCVIGITGNLDDPNCINGIALGVGDNYYAIAVYN